MENNRCISNTASSHQILSNLSSEPTTPQTQDDLGATALLATGQTVSIVSTEALIKSNEGAGINNCREDQSVLSRTATLVDTPEASEVTKKQDTLTELPYPLYNFPHLQVDNFLEKNRTELMVYLAQLIPKDFNENPEEIYKIFDFQWLRPNHLLKKYRNQASLALNLKFVNKDNNPIVIPLYFSASDTNQGNYIIDCFAEMILGIKFNISMFTALASQYPQMLDNSTRSYIRFGDIPTGNCYIFIKGDNCTQSFNIKNFFNQETQELNIDNLYQQIRSNVLHMLLDSSKYSL
jgi:hypothetical protein